MLRLYDRLRGLRRLRRLVPGSLAGSLARALRPGPSTIEPHYRPLRDSVNRRLIEAGERETAAWDAIETLEEWTAFVRPRIDAMRDSLRVPAPDPHPPARHVTATFDAGPVRIENVVYRSRPGLWVTANLYGPRARRASMPLVVIAHSHHHPKTQRELREMGVEWARAGCLVLIPDLVGHGERRDHPFDTADAFPHRFRLSRQDYWFRYVLGMQLELIGESLMGWMVRDLIRGIDLALAQPDVDPDRVILVGSVAGGGDVAAVTAALDPRIGCVVPFNFGRGIRLTYRGARKHRTEHGVSFAGVGGWESTRCLRDSVACGFTPWVILASIAPRYLVYAHEFGWRADDDPVWVRLRKVFTFHDADDRLAAIHGAGTVRGRPPANTHCANVGSVHRRQLNPLLERWFGIEVEPERGSVLPRPSKLLCWTDELRRSLRPQPVHRVALDLARAGSPPGVGWERSRVRTLLPKAVGNPHRHDPGQAVERRSDRLRDGFVDSFRFQVEAGVEVRARLLRPAGRSARPLPVVLALAHEGGQALLAARRRFVDRLLELGVAVCAVDVRGSGTSRYDDLGRGRHSLATTVAAGELMLGRSLLGAKLNDVLAVFARLGRVPELDTNRVAFWGDALGPVNSSRADCSVPFDAEPSPSLAEPLGGVLALIAAMHVETTRAVYASGLPPSFVSYLEHPFCHHPRDVVVPGLCHVDLPDLMRACPAEIRLGATVDGMNCRVGDGLAAPAGVGVEDGSSESSAADETSEWIANLLHGTA